MIGVVVWSDPPTGRAVVWCDDHQGLAYLLGKEASTLKTPAKSGDVLSFSVVECVGGQRTVLNPVHLDEDWGRELIDRLRSTTKAQENTEDNVIPLRPFGRTDPPSVQGINLKFKR